MPDDNQNLVRTRDLSWDEICRKAWGKDWNKPEVVYEWSSGKKYEDAAHGGPYTDSTQ